MFGRAPKSEAQLDAVMNRVFDDMEEIGPDAEEYASLLGYLERMYVLRDSKEKRKASPDGILLVAGNLLGILIIVAYEQKHVMSSKGLGFVMKPKS